MAYIREYPLGILPGTTCILIFVERHWYIKNLEFSIALQTCTKLQLLTLLQRTLSLCQSLEMGFCSRKTRGTRCQIKQIDPIPIYQTAYYRPDSNVSYFYYVAILFSVPSHQQFNSLYRVKFKRRIRNNETRRPQTGFYFIVVIFRTDLLSQGKIPVFFFNYLLTNIAWSRGQKSDVQSVRNQSRGWFLSTYTA